VKLIVRNLGTVDYEQAWKAMREYTDLRNKNSDDQIWLLQHPSVYTLGQAGKPEHLHDAGSIPVIKCDRGGQITYHGPGQLICYVLLDLRRLKLTIKQLIFTLEQTVIDLLRYYGIDAQRREKAPGIYVNDKKIASLGLRVRNGCTYHGLSLNVNMDLKPFNQIDPCGYSGMEMTQLSELGVTDSTDVIANGLINIITARFHYELE